MCSRHMFSTSTGDSIFHQDILCLCWKFCWHVLTGQALFGSLQVGYFQQHGHVTPCAFFQCQTDSLIDSESQVVSIYVYEQWLIDYLLTCLSLSHVTAFVVSILPLKNMCRGLSRILAYFHMSYDHMSTWAHENEHQFSYDAHRLKKWFQSYGPISICNGTFLKFQVLFLYVIFFWKNILCIWQLSLI